VSHALRVITPLLVVNVLLVTLVLVVLMLVIVLTMVHAHLAQLVHILMSLGSLHVLIVLVHTSNLIRVNQCAPTVLPMLVSLFLNPHAVVVLRVGMEFLEQVCALVAQMVCLHLLVMQTTPLTAHHVQPERSRTLLLLEYVQIVPQVHFKLKQARPRAPPAAVE